MSLAEAPAQIPGLTQDWWGRISYEQALKRMEAVHRLRALKEVGDAAFYLEHDPVISFGRATSPDDLNLTAHDIPLVEVARGGLATYHGPGQLVGYYIVDLKDRSGQSPDIHDYLRALEEGLILFLGQQFGLQAIRREGFTGVWTHGFDCPSLGQVPRKLASIGVSARKWVTSHGFALNISTDLSAFKNIVPCGITDAEMTSVQNEFELVGRAFEADSLEAISAGVHQHMYRTFQDAGWCQLEKDPV